MKKTKRILIIAFLLCIFIYCCKINSIPNQIILYGGEQLKIGNFLGISLKIGNKDCQTSSSIIKHGRKPKQRKQNSNQLM